MPWLMAVSFMTVTTKGPHHLGVLAFEDVAVVDEAARDVEPYGDLDDVAGIDPDDVLPAVGLGRLEAPAVRGRGDPDRGERVPEGRVVEARAVRSCGDVEQAAHVVEGLELGLVDVKGMGVRGRVDEAPHLPAAQLGPQRDPVVERHPRARRRVVVGHPALDPVPAR